MTQTSQPSESLFKNLVAINGYNAPFVDRYSQFGVVFEPGRPIGPGMLQTRSAAHTYQVSSSTLTLWLHENGNRISVERTGFESTPWCIIERAQLEISGGRLAIEARHTFMSEVTLRTEFAFVNHSPSAFALPISWHGQISGDRWHTTTNLPLRETWGTLQGTGLRGGLKSEPKTHALPAPAFQLLSDAADALKVALSEKPLWLSENKKGIGKIDGLFGKSIFYSLSPKPFTLKPGASRSFGFAIEFSVASYLDKQHHFKGVVPEKYDMDTAVDASRKDFERRVGLSKPPAAAKSPLLQQRLWRARTALLRTGYRGRGKGGEYGNGIASTCVPNCGGFTRVFFWDALFSAAALATFEPEFAREAILAVFARQTQDGYCPEHSFNYQVPWRDPIGAPQAPVASWAVARYLADHPEDTSFLKKIVPFLERNHRFWMDRSDRDADGLAEWTWSGQTADNSPLYDEYTKHTGWIPPVASVQLNAFLYRDAMTLAQFSEILGKKREAAAYRKAAEQRAEAFMKICYLPKEKRFWDYNHATGRHCKVKTFYMFWPIWAGMKMPAQVKKDLIENVLLDPRQFLGDIPFPSVAYDEPTYDSHGYWRGRIWPQISFWLLEMLVAEGYIKEADQAADRLFSAWTREATYPENLCSDANAYSAAGVPDYNWGIAFVSLLGGREYRKIIKP